MIKRDWNGLSKWLKARKGKRQENDQKRLKWVKVWLMAKKGKTQENDQNIREKK